MNNACDIKLKSLELAKDLLCERSRVVASTGMTVTDLIADAKKIEAYLLSSGK